MDPLTIALGKAWEFLGVRGAIAAGLGVALLLSFWNAHRLSGQLDDAKVALGVEQANHAVTRASVASLSDKLEGFVQEGLVRQERVTEALKDVSKEVKPLQDQADALDRGEIAFDELEGL